MHCRVARRWAHGAAGLQFGAVGHRDRDRAEKQLRHFIAPPLLVPERTVGALGLLVGRLLAPQNERRRLHRHSPSPHPPQKKAEGS